MNTHPPNEETIQESWESTEGTLFTIAEAASEVDGEHIIGKFSGPAFFPETLSKNNVFYPQEAWESAISESDFQARLRDRLVLGTIGHNSELTDNDVRDGKASHIVSRVWIGEDNIGKADYLILNTKAGRNLNTLIRAGVKLRVSTKADGLFKSTSQSQKTVVPSAFRLVRIDFVQSPGYNQALPSILESQEAPLELPILDAPIAASDSSNVVQESSINLLPNEGPNMENDKVVQILESHISELKAEKTITSQQIQAITEELGKVKTNMASTSAILENYQALGTTTQILEAQSELAQYKVIGTVHDIHEAIETGTEALTTLSTQVDELKDTIVELQQQVTDANDGADAAIAAAVVPADPAAPVTEDGEELGTPSDIRNALDQAEIQRVELESYRELGSVAEIKAALDAAEGVAESIEGSQADQLAADFGVPVEKVTMLQDKGMSLDEIGAFLKDIMPAKSTSEAAEVVDPNNPLDTETASPEKVDPAGVNTTAVAPVVNPEEPEIVESYSSRLFGRIRKTHQITESKDAATVTPINTSLGARLMNRR